MGGICACSMSFMTMFYNLLWLISLHENVLGTCTFETIVALPVSFVAYLANTCNVTDFLQTQRKMLTNQSSFFLVDKLIRVLLIIIGMLFHTCTRTPIPGILRFHDSKDIFRMIFISDSNI